MSNLNSFIAALGTIPAVSDPSETSYYSNDLFFWEGHKTASCVVKPRTAAEVATIVRAAQAHGMAIYSRGGGMSYTNGYGPDRENAAIIDMTGLNRVIEVDPVSRYIAVDCGCTWAQVVQALAPHGLVVDFAPPLSGSHSTVGGALSQNVPGGMQGVLGLEVVRADGDIVKTGAWAVARNGKPFTRNYGPDLTGLFLGDNGTLGIKTAAAFHVKRKAPHMTYASFAYETYEDMAATMVELSPYDFIARRTGLDPHESQTIAKVSFKDAVAAVAKVAGAENSLTGSMKAMAEMAKSGLNFMDGVKWSMHLKVESHSERAAEDGMAIVKPICARRGREFPPILPRAREAVGFSIRKFLGKDGERWVATSAIFPIARAVEVARATEKFFRDNKADMDRHGVVHSYISNYGPQYFLTEPCFFWQDELTELHFRALPPEDADAFRKLTGKSGIRDYVQALRFRLRDMLFEMGAVHVQIGGFYRFRESLDASTLKLVEDLKDLLDPTGLLNPGKLDRVRGPRA